MYKGVCFREQWARWTARIHLTEDGVARRINLGTFKSEIEAAMAYDDAARLAYGEFARVNFQQAADLGI